MRGLYFILIFIAMSIAIGAWAKGAQRLPSYAPTAKETKVLKPEGCIPGINRTFTFEGHLVGNYVPAVVDHPQAEVFMWLKLSRPISVCSFHFAGTLQPAYTDVSGIGFGITDLAHYRRIMKFWGKDQILMTGSLWNITFTGHGGGPIFLTKTKRFCYSKKSAPAAFLCMPWRDFESLF